MDRRSKRHNREEVLWTGSPTTYSREVRRSGLKARGGLDGWISKREVQRSRSSKREDLDVRDFKREDPNG